MRKITAVLISVTLIAAFGGLVYYGLMHSRGVPTAVEEPKKIILEAPFINTEIDLAKGISPEIWDSLKTEKIELIYQLTVLPWPKKGLIPSLIVKAFHNKADIFFYLSWEDDTEDRRLETNKFSDACAIMFPMDEKAQPSSIMMGFLGRSNIWQWKASQDIQYWLNELPKTEVYVDYYYPFEEEETLSVSKVIPKSAVNDLIAIRVGTVTPKDIQNVSGRGFWKDGHWQVVFKRSLEVVATQDDAAFNPGKRLCAFAVWNGAKGDRGGRKSISDWVELKIR